MLTTQVTQMGTGYDSTRKRNGLRQDMLRLLSKAFKCIDFEKQMQEIQSWFEKVARYLIQNKYMKIQKLLVKVFGEVL